MDIRQRVREFVTGQLGDAVLREGDFRGEQSFYIKPDALLSMCEALHDDADLDIKFLADITVVDWLDDEWEQEYGRFEVVYNLYSLTHQYRFFLKVFLPGDKPEIASLTPIWNSANWLEREAYDLFGVTFVGHPDLTKILTPDDLEGFPLRKDFPLTYEQPTFSWNKDQPPEVVR